MTKFAAISLAAVVGLAGTFGGIRMTNAASRSKISSETKYAEAENIAETTSDPITGADSSTWSPFTDCASLEEAENAAGFEMVVPDTIGGYKNVSYAAMKEYPLIQVQYYSDEDRCISVRKALDDEDISGDYKSYSYEEKVPVDGTTVLLKGNNGLISLAIWQKEGDSFSAGVYDYSSDKDAGLSRDEMIDIVKSIR